MPTITPNANAPVKDSFDAMLDSLREESKPFVGAAAEQADPDEEITLQSIALDKDELLLFKDADEDVSYCISELIQQTELENSVTEIMRSLFADCTRTVLYFNPTFSKWQFVVQFTAMTDQQLKQLNADNGTNLTTALTCKTVDLSGSPTAVLKNIFDNVQMSASDSEKYAKVSKEAKSYLTNLLFVDSKTNPNKKWIRKRVVNDIGNYEVSILSNKGNAYGGAESSCIVGSIFLDAEKVIARLCCSLEKDADGKIVDEKDKYIFTINQTSMKTSGNDVLYEIKRQSKKMIRTYTTKYGINFTVR